MLISCIILFWNTQYVLHPISPNFHSGIKLMQQFSLCLYHVQSAPLWNHLNKSDAKSHCNTNVLQSSRISQKLAALIVRYTQKQKWISIVSFCSENPSIAHNLGTTGLIKVGFSAKCTFPNEDFNQIKKWNMCNFWLILLDRITNAEKHSYVTMSLLKYGWNTEYLYVSSANQNNTCMVCHIGLVPGFMQLSLVLYCSH